MLVVRSRCATQISYQFGTKAGYLQAWEGETISQIKEKIFKKENVAVNTVSLSQQDGLKRLNDKDTVASSGITLNSIITCT